MADIDVRDYLREQISKKGLIQRAIADKVGMKPWDISNRLLKKRKLDANELIQICKVTGIDPMGACEKNIER